MLDSQHRVYLAGLLGGGTWDFRTETHSRDLLTYRDYRVVFGLEYADHFRRLSSVELGYAFSRQVRLTEAVTTDSFPDAFILQWVSRF